MKIFLGKLADAAANIITVIGALDHAFRLDLEARAVGRAHRARREALREARESTLIIG